LAQSTLTVVEVTVCPALSVIVSSKVASQSSLGPASVLNVVVAPVGLLIVHE
jgi:hypothetical protein